MSGLETLPPDQRAVLQLILVQGRGYADLATLLKLDEDAVRGRAVAGLDALGLPGRDDLDASERARIADYLLGQQDEGERIVTFAALAESPEASRWAQALRERLGAIAHEELPAVPAVAGASTNGHAPAPAAKAAPAMPTAAAATPAPAPATSAEPAPPRPAVTASRPTQPSSRLGGAVLLAGIAALAIVLAIVLIGGGGDDAGTTTPAATQPAGRQPTRTPAAQAAPNVVATANLMPTAAGGQGLAVAIVQPSGRRLVLSMLAERLPANGANDRYGLWLQGSAGQTFRGFVRRPVGTNGKFSISTDLPANARSYDTVLITREGITAVPSTPGTTILSGALRFVS